MTRKSPPCWPKVLLVDDRTENLLVLQTILKESEVELVLAQSGAEALEQLLEHDVAVALIDVQMPEMDGFELARLMRGTKRTSSVPIIFVTAGASEKAREFRGYDAGAVDFLFKPLDPEVLLSKVNVFAQLQRQKEELASMLRLSEELVAVVSHDLRNPLNSILMSSQLFPMLTTDARILGAAEKIERSSKRMNSIISDLLDLSRARLGGGIPVSKEPCDLLEIAKTTTDELAASCSTRNLSLTYQGNLVGRWDCSRIGQVLSNLLGNAMDHGQGDVGVHLDGSNSHNVAIRVSNGGEIPARHIPTLFEPFVSGQGDGRSDGLGLGLYIVQQIAHAHGGEVSVDSSAAAGTNFHVRLPR